MEYTPQKEAEIWRQHLDYTEVFNFKHRVISCPVFRVEIIEPLFVFISKKNRKICRVVTKTGMSLYETSKILKSEKNDSGVD